MEVIGNDSCSSNLTANCISDLSSVSVVHMLQQLLDSSSFNETKIKGMVALLKRAKDDVAPFEDLDQILLENDSLSLCLEEASAAPADIDGIIKRAESLLDVLADQALETKFNGETVDWFRFWEAFKSEIHNRDDLPLALKFACLKRRLEGWPLNMLEKLGSGNSVYNQALKLLQTIFSNKEIVVESHLNALLNLDPAIATPISLMRFSSEFEYHIRALKAYGASIEEASCMVAPVLNKKFPKQIWNRFNKADRASYWDLLEFQNALKFEIELFNFELSQQANNHSVVETQNVSTVSVDESVFKIGSENDNGFQDSSKYSLICQLCSDCHHFSGCSIYKTSFQKLKRSQQLELCLMCVKRDHTTEKCLKPICCTLCKGKHNTMLCLESSQLSLTCQLCSGYHLYKDCPLHRTPAEPMERTKELGFGLWVNVDHATEKCLKTGCKFCNRRCNTLPYFSMTSEVKSNKIKVNEESKRCQLCSLSHDITGCTAYKSPLEKMERAKELELCLLCIKDEHLTENCLKKDGCKFCKEKHNTLLCVASNPSVCNTNKIKNIIELCVLCSGSHNVGSCSAYRTSAEKMERSKELKLCLFCVTNDHMTEKCPKKCLCQFCNEKHNTLLCVNLKVCPLCLGSHDLTGCFAYKTSVQKMKRVKELKLCLLCFKAKHAIENCPKKDGCKFCNEKHNTLLCLSANSKCCSKPIKKKKKKKFCILCSGSHVITGCDAYKTSVEKMKRAKELQLCLLCVKDDHVTEKCPKNRRCKFCNEKHNTLLCKKTKSKKIKKVIKLCPLCSRPHDITGCSAYKTPVEKMKKAKELKLCLLCLKAKHLTKNCQDVSKRAKKEGCKFCKEKHNTLLCVSTNSNIYNTNKKIKNKWLCSLCSEYHDITGCTIYKTPLERMGRAKVLNLCLVCIKADHTTKKCVKTTWCKRCYGKHNTLLCNLGKTKVNWHQPFVNINEQEILQCVLCFGCNHQFGGCPKFNTPFKRHERAVILNLCLLCLESSHSTSQCLSVKHCKFCEEKHNTQLCLQTQKPKKKKKKKKTKKLKQEGNKQAKGLKAYIQSIKSNADSEVLECPLCWGSHHFLQCSKYKTPVEKRVRAVQLNLCLVCGINTHVTSDCLMMDVCEFCYGRHHSYLCIDIKAETGKTKSQANKGALRSTKEKRGALINNSLISDFISSSHI